jgi:hypothetical protein
MESPRQTRFNVGENSVDSKKKNKELPKIRYIKKHDQPKIQIKIGRQNIHKTSESPRGYNTKATSKLQMPF